MGFRSIQISETAGDRVRVALLIGAVVFAAIALNLLAASKAAGVF